MPSSSDPDVCFGVGLGTPWSLPLGHSFPLDLKFFFRPQYYTYGATLTRDGGLMRDLGFLLKHWWSPLASLDLTSLKFLSFPIRPQYYTYGATLTRDGYRMDINARILLTLSSLKLLSFPIYRPQYYTFGATLISDGVRMDENERLFTL